MKSKYNYCLDKMLSSRDSPRSMARRNPKTEQKIIEEMKERAEK